MPPRLLDYLYDKMLSRVGLALLALALLINIGAPLVVNSQVGKLDQARTLTLQSRNVMTEIIVVQSMLYESESAQRGFLYTDKPSYLAPLNENENQIMARLAKLREMVADNLQQQTLVDHLRQIAREKLSELTKTVAIHQMGRKDDARAIVLSDQGKKLMGEFDTEVSGFLANEDVQLKERRQNWTDIQLTMRWGFAAIFFVNAVLLLAGAVTIMRDLARKRLTLVQLDERAAVLASEVAMRAAELRALSAYLLRVQEDERRTIARELHDELGGTLSAIKMDIVMGRDAAVKRSDEKSVARLARAHTAIDGAIQFTRRMIEDLRPTLLDNLGFEAALRSMTGQFSERTGCACVISLPEGELNLTPAQSTTLYRICQEALTNVMKYAKARQVTISLTRDESQWKLLLADDGVGLKGTQQHGSMSHGLLGMRERIVALGGTFDIRGDAGRGTRLNATFPVVESDPSPG